MLEGLELRPHPAGAERCAVCHGDFDAEPYVCKGCDARFHHDCRSALRQCSTIGCKAGKPRELLPLASEREAAQVQAAQAQAPPPPVVGPSTISGRYAARYAPVVSVVDNAIFRLGTLSYVGLVVLVAVAQLAIAYGIPRSPGKTQLQVLVLGALATHWSAPAVLASMRRGGGFRLMVLMGAVQGTLVVPMLVLFAVAGAWAPLVFAAEPVVFAILAGSLGRQTR